MQCVCCNYLGRMRGAQGVVDGQSLCGNHMMLWREWIKTTDFAVMRVSLRMHDFVTWLGVTNHV